MNVEEMKSFPVMARQSCIKCAIGCKRKWLYKYRLGIELRGEQMQEAATLGKIYHKFMQYGPGNDARVSGWVKQLQVNLMARVDKGEDIDGTMVRKATELTHLYNRAKAMAHIFWEAFPLPPYLEIVGTEIDCSYRIGEVEVGGTIDRILQNTDTGRFWIGDYKSTGRKLEAIFGGLAWSVQARLYRLLTIKYLEQKQMLRKGDDDLKGLIMDGIVRPGIKLCRTDEKNAKTWGVSIDDAYLQRVKDWYKEKEEAGEPVMLSKAIIFAEPVMNRELMEAISMIARLNYEPQKLERFPRDITRMACYRYERQCEYHDLCETDPAYWDGLFEIKYKIKEEETK